jgi:hypothetical protein
MKGGNIDAISDLVFRNVPMIRDNSVYKGYYDNIIQVLKVKNLEDSQITWTELAEVLENKVYISDEWKQYIKFSNSDVPAQRFTLIKLSFIDSTVPNTQTKDDQTLLYLAAQNCNKIMFDALVAMGADPKILNKGNSSSILHGIAWGSTKTYDEKVAFIQEILARHPTKTIPLLFLKNDRGKTFYDNLLIKHPDKISIELEDVAFPIRWVRNKDANGINYYKNTFTDTPQWNRPY